MVIQKYVKAKIKSNLAFKQQYDQKINSIIKIQRAVRDWLRHQNTESSDFIRKYKDRRLVYSNSEVQIKETYWFSHTLISSHIRRFLDGYQAKTFKDFEKAWRDYELKLYKYETTK